MYSNYKIEIGHDSEGSKTFSSHLATEDRAQLITILGKCNEFNFSTYKTHPTVMIEYSVFYYMKLERKTEPYFL